jgi:CheY-like chemotaxis protein/predicted  nucleic acid-binding Zn-ribbon protein
MSKKILLIESDTALAEELASTLGARGLEVRTTGDGREGFEIAKEWGPDAIVLCVELPGMSGYVICQKLKKDEALKSVPLVITSAEATPETFEKHKTLKVRAEDYLLKPFTPTGLLAALGALIEIPDAPEGALEEPLAGLADEPAAGGDEEELVALEEEAGIEALGGEPLGGEGDLPALDLGALPDDGPAPAAGPGLDDDLKLLDEAFDGLSEPGAAPKAAPKPAPRGAKPAARPPPALDLGADEKPVGADELDAAASSLPEEDDRAARAALGRLDLAADEALDALGGGEAAPAAPHEPEPESGTDLGRDLLGGLDDDLGLGAAPEPEAESDLSLPPEPEPEPAAPPVRGASLDALRAAGIKPLAEKAPPAPPAGAPSADAARLERELTRAQRRAEELEARLREAEDRLSGTEARADEAEQRAEAAERRASEAGSKLAAAESAQTTAKSRLDAATAQAKRLDADLKTARERLAHAEAAVDDERRRADDAEARAAAAAEALDKVSALEREVDEVKTELVVARGEAEGARGEVEKRTAELKRRVQDLEGASAKNEERVVKAYLKIKNDEKVREKTRKALAIAMQLIDEGAPAESSGEKARSAGPSSSGLGREQ